MPFAQVAFCHRVIEAVAGHEVHADAVAVHTHVHPLSGEGTPAHPGTHSRRDLSVLGGGVEGVGICKACIFCEMSDVIVGAVADVLL